MGDYKFEFFPMALNQDYDFLFKVLIIGNSHVGKSNILLRFSENVFHESFLPTIGVDFKIKNVDVNDKVVKLHIWDTAGQERFKTITATYYKGAHGIILVYDITDRNTFNDIENWLAEIASHASPGVAKLLIGNKCDMEGDRQVSWQEGKDFADSLGVPFLETSAKQRINIEECFKSLTLTILPNAQPPAKDKQGGGHTISRDNTNRRSGGDGGCGC